LTTDRILEEPCEAISFMHGFVAERRRRLLRLGSGLLNTLKNHLRPLERRGLLVLWHDRDIRAGSDWEKEINRQLFVLKGRIAAA
jgi:hypothetical protein